HLYRLVIDNDKSRILRRQQAILGRIADRFTRHCNSPFEESAGQTPTWFHYDLPIYPAARMTGPVACPHQSAPNSVKADAVLRHEADRTRRSAITAPTI